MCDSYSTLNEQLRTKIEKIFNVEHTSLFEKLKEFSQEINLSELPNDLWNRNASFIIEKLKSLCIFKCSIPTLEKAIQTNQEQLQGEEAKILHDPIVLDWLLYNPLFEISEISQKATLMQYISFYNATNVFKLINHHAYPEKVHIGDRSPFFIAAKKCNMDIFFELYKSYPDYLIEGDEFNGTAFSAIIAWQTTKPENWNTVKRILQGIGKERGTDLLSSSLKKIKDLRLIQWLQKNPFTFEIAKETINTFLLREVSIRRIYDFIEKEQTMFNFLTAMNEILGKQKIEWSTMAPKIFRAIHEFEKPQYMFDSIMVLLHFLKMKGCYVDEIIRTFNQHPDIITYIALADPKNFHMTIDKSRNGFLYEIPINRHKAIAEKIEL